MGSSMSAIRDREDQERYEELYLKGEEVLKDMNPYQYIDNLNKLSQLIAGMQHHYVGSMGRAILDQMREVVNELKNKKK